MLLNLIRTQPIWIKFLSVVVGTFILEDATTVLTAIASENDLIPQTPALAALYTGVFLGDLLLYGLGMLAAKWYWVSKYLRLAELPSSVWTWKRVWGMVFLARFTLGARAPIYTTSGLCKVPFTSFALSCFIATIVWTSFLFYISLYFGKYLLQHQDYYHEIAIAGFLIGLASAAFVISTIRKYSQRIGSKQ